MKKLAEWLGIEKEPAPAVSVEYTPESREDLIGVLKRTPDEVLDAHQKKLISRVLAFEERKVAEAMLPREQLMLVNDTDFLGPLTLDKLYKSGFSHFPVVDRDRHILGLLHTEALNNLEIRDGVEAKQYIDKNVLYVRADYLLTEALAVMIRNDRTYLVVIDRYERLVGITTLTMIIKLLLGYVPDDNFKQDSSALAVAKREF